MKCKIISHAYFLYNAILLISSEKKFMIRKFQNFLGRGTARPFPKPTPFAKLMSENFGSITVPPDNKSWLRPLLILAATSGLWKIPFQEFQKAQFWETWPNLELEYLCKHWLAERNWNVVVAMLMMDGWFRVSEEIGKGDAGRKSWASAADSEEDADHNAGELFLSARNQRRWIDWTHGQVCHTGGAQSWQQIPRLQKFSVQDHRSEGLLVIVCNPVNFYTLLITLAAA